MKKITKIAVIYSATRKTDEALFRVNEIIESSNSEVILSTNIKKLNTETIKKASKAELILVLGGDGTMIGSIRNLHSLNVPFLGINSGTVGFLTDLSLSKIEKLKEILQGYYLKESRPVFEAYTSIRKKEIFLNEVVIHSGSVTKMLDLEISLKDQVIYNLKADGLIISSSTGSTAYSYSGGGPIISPKLDAISLLPMFSHSSSSHSLLLSDKEEVTVKIKNKNLNSTQIFVDGKKNLKYTNKGLKVSNTKKTFKLYHPKDYNYFEACRTKLGWAVSIEHLKQD
jgi:NAD+ kinase